MDLGLEGRVALVTGGSRGIGRAAAMSLAAEGCAVAVSARGQEGVDDAVAALRETGARAHGVVADMAETDGPARAVEEAERVLGPVDVVVANAGGPPQGGFMESDEFGWDLALRQNLMGTVRLIRAALPSMRARQWGRIITVTSSSVREPIDGLTLSIATRAGVAGVVRTLAREVAADGITVNNVLPGPILTDRQRSLLARQGDLEAALAARSARHPMLRIGRPEEVGDVIAFLASTRAGFVTGVSVLVDGGESRVLA